MSRGKMDKPLLVVLCMVAASGVASLAWAFVTWETSDTSDQAVILFFYGVLVLTFLSTGLAFTLRPRRPHPATASTSVSTASSTTSDAPPEYRDTWRREYKKKIRHEASPEEPRGVTGVEVGGRTIEPDVEADSLPPYSLYSQETPTLHVFQSTPTATEIQEHTSISQPEAYTGNLDRLAWVFGGASQADTQTHSSQPEAINARNQDARSFRGASWVDAQTRSPQPGDIHTGTRHLVPRLSTGEISRVGRYTFTSQPERINIENLSQPGASRFSTYTSSSQLDLHVANQDRLARVSTRGPSRTDRLTYHTASSGDSLFLKAMLHTASSHPP